MSWGLIFALAFGLAISGYAAYQLTRLIRFEIKMRKLEKVVAEFHKLSDTLLDLQKQFNDQNAQLPPDERTKLWKPVEVCVTQSINCFNAGQDPLTPMRLAISTARTLVAQAPSRQ